MLKTWFWSWTRQNASKLPLAVPCPDGRRQQEGPLDLDRAGSDRRWAIIGSALNRLFVTANLIQLLPSLSSGWPPLLIFCSWQMAPLFLASSRNWFLLTGKERSWLERGCWLSKETAPQPVGERLLRRLSWSSCEKTKPLFPRAASLVRSTASQADAGSKGNKMSPAPASRFSLLFFPPPFCWGLRAPGDVCSSVDTRLHQEQDVSASKLTPNLLVRSSSGTQPPSPGTASRPGHTTAQAGRDLSNHILKTSSDGDSTTSLERLFQWLIVLSGKKIFFISRNLPNLYSSCGSFRGKGLHPLSSHSLSTGKPWWGHCWAFTERE